MVSRQMAALKLTTSIRRIPFLDPRKLEHAFRMISAGIPYYDCACGLS